jgi:predicted nucleic acid-binding protein
MYGFFDSSFLLSFLLGEKNQKEVVDIWKCTDTRFGSILLRIETNIVMRRFYSHYQKELGTSWYKDHQKVLNEMLEEVNLRVVDEEIYQTILLKKELSNCKTLDAIHLATALEFQAVVGINNLIVYTYDEQMKNTCKLLSLNII